MNIFGDIIVNDAASFSDETIKLTAHGVLDTTFPYSQWDHAAHFAFALWMLRNPRELEVHGGIERILRRYNKAVGIPDIPTRGYHETIIAASMRAAAWFLDDCGATAPLSVVLSNIMGSELGNPQWLLAYWSEPVLMSLLARKTSVSPDRKTFSY